MFGPPSDWEYSAALTASVIVGASVFWIRLRRATEPGWGTLAFIAGAALAAIVGARLYAVLESGHVLTSWGWLESGYRHPGAIAALLIAVPILRSLCLPYLSLAQLADILAPAAAFAMATMRLGCLAVGCCFGTVTHLPWAVQFPMGSLAANLHSTAGWLAPGATTSLPVHPLQIYFALLALGVGVLLLWFERRRPHAGALALTFLVLHESGKFLLEFLRAPGLTASSANVQLLSLAVALAAMTALATLRPRRYQAGRTCPGRSTIEPETRSKISSARCAL